MAHVIPPVRLPSMPQPGASVPIPRRVPMRSQQTAQPSAAPPASADFKTALKEATPSPAPPPVAPEPPTAESVFGPNPWIPNPTGVAPNGKTFSYNKHYFASAETAQKVAQMAGGTVVQTNVFTPNGGGGFMQQQPNYMVQLPDGRLINPGLVAAYYTHGYSQAWVNELVAAEFRSTT